MSKIRQILRLYAQGESKRKISEMTGTARNTLKKYILQFIEMRLTMDTINEMDDQALDLFFGAAPEPPMSARYEKLHALLPAYEKLIKRKGVTVTMLWEQYREACPDGYALTQFFQSLVCLYRQGQASHAYRVGKDQFQEQAGEWQS